MFLAGLLRMTELGEAETVDRLLAAVLPELAGTVRLTRRQVNRIGGWFADVSLPPARTPHLEGYSWNHRRERHGR